MGLAHMNSKPILQLYWHNELHRKPLIVRIGHNYLDKTPLIGQIVDINMWDRWETINNISGIQLKVFRPIQNYPKKTGKSPLVVANVFSFKISSTRLLSHEEALDITNCIRYTKTPPGNLFWVSGDSLMKWFRSDQ